MAPTLGVSAAQQWMWLAQKRSPGFSNNVTILWEIHGEVDLDWLHDVPRTVVDTEEALRVNFAEGTSGLRQEVSAPGRFVPFRHDVSATPEGSRHFPRSRLPLQLRLLPHAKNRLDRFVNQHDFFPTRREFHDYLEWVESAFTPSVTYGTEALSVRPPDGAVPGEPVDRLYVDVRPGGSVRTVAARNVVISTGLRPRLPDGVEAGPDVWHS